METPTVKVNLWRNFKPLNQALPALKRRLCWQSCDDCKKAWRDITTVFVHMKITATIQAATGAEGGRVKASQETRYICDDCLRKRDLLK